MNARRAVGTIVTVVLAVVVIAGLAMGDPSPEDRTYALGREIKCPVCQGTAIADSPSETALAMMDIVREKVEGGESDSQILDYFVARYGEWVLLDPPARGRNLLLWAVPVVVVAGGVVLILRRKRAGPVPAEVETEEAGR